MGRFKVDTSPVKSPDVTIHPGRMGDREDYYTRRPEGIYINGWIWESYFHRIANSRVTGYSFDGDTEAPTSDWLDLAHDLETLVERLTSCQFNDEVDLELSWLGGSPFRDDKQFHSEREEFLSMYSSVASWIRRQAAFHDWLWFCGM